MLSHVFFSVSDFDRALAFYGAVMDGLGLERRFRDPDGNKLCVVCHDAAG
ncbi:MAG: hypothetical protein U1B84_17290 [Variovorax sp.]|nr:hypothetical protein [Variovorax sp.]